MGRIKDHSTGSPVKDDAFIFDGTNGTKKVLAKDVLLAVLKTSGSTVAGLHNSIYRGVNLKTHWGLTTDAQVVSKVTTNISNGTFEDLFIGDYFDVTINSEVGGSEVVTCVIAGFDIYLNCGDTALTQHHAVIVPKNCFKTKSAMNSSGTTSGGYVGSAMYTNILPKYATALQTALSNHIISHRELLTNAVNTSAKSGGYSAWDGAASDWAWKDSLIELMSEPEVYGSKVWSSSAYDVGIAKVQLPLFALNPAMIQANLGNTTTRQWYWLKAVASSTDFCCVRDNGGADSGGASDSSGVRPRFLIG